MTLRTLRRCLPALALALSGVPVAAADGPLLPGPGGHEAAGTCTTCQKHNTRLGSDCPTCVNGKYGIGWKKRPTIPSLAPGACFGYFPTQWNRWSDVCPLPHPGHGIDDPGMVSTAARKADPKADGKTAPPPKPLSDAPPAGGKGTGAELPKTGVLPNVPEAPKDGLPMPAIPPAPLPKP